MSLIRLISRSILLTYWEYGWPGAMVSFSRRNVFLMPAKGLLISCATPAATRSEEHTSELQSRLHLVCRLLLEKKKKSVTLEGIAPDRWFRTRRRVCRHV